MSTHEHAGRGFHHWCPFVFIRGFFIAAAAVLAADAGAGTNRLTRAESFLGIHFDFHAGPDCTEVGKNTTTAMVEHIIATVHPDYIQIDCKGHPGYCSYPTKVGNPVPGFVGDPLRVWRDVTAANGVGLYMHYSGVWDSRAVQLHPEWGAINADGKVNGKATSLFGPYADQLLIPQLRELAGVYGVDGAWVDGECWAAVPDYSERAVAAFRAATGIQEVPRKPGDAHWFDFLQFHREAFRAYLRHYVGEVKKTHPSFQLCSNWAFTDHMAEPVSAPLDFLSGDYSPENSVNSARLSARFLARQGTPWDLMAWSFSGPKGGRTQKSAAQLQRETAVVLALGGGFQAYFKQNRDGSIHDEQMPVMGEVAAFCRARQAVCHRAQPIPQIGLLLSQAGHYRRLSGLFNRDLDVVADPLQALLDSRLAVDVVGEHQVAGRMKDWPLLVVPEWDTLAPGCRDDLVAYVRDGGHLLLIGPGPAALFAAELGSSTNGTPVALGRGRLAALPASFSRDYKGRAGGEAARTVLAGLVRQLFPHPLVEVTGEGFVDVCPARQGDRLLVHLVNTTGPHETESIQDSVPAIGPLQVAVRLDHRPAAVTLEPGSRQVAFDWQDGAVRVTVPKLEIHEILALRP